MRRDCLPESLQNKAHNDWPWPFSYIPRSWTAFCLGAPELLWGTQKERRIWPDGTIGPAPIPERGTWQVSGYPDKFLLNFPLYFAVTFKNGWSFRIGARGDDVDGYVQFPSVAFRKYSGDRIQDTST